MSSCLSLSLQDYPIFNDFSARDIQLREMQGRLGPAKGKDFDTGNVLRPYLVTYPQTVLSRSIWYQPHLE